MKREIVGASLMLCTLTGSPALADQPPATSTAMAAAATPATPTNAGQKPPFVAAGFHVPVSAQAPGFRIVPLSPALAKIDFDAYMSSIEHLQKTFSRSDKWPHKDISAADAVQDMENEQARFQGRKSFAYAVLTPDGRRERGCVYVSPSPVAGYDAVVRMWVTKADHEAGFDAELFKWVTGWIQAEWPFRNVAYPGRGIEWARWDAMVAANKAPATRAQ